MGGGEARKEAQRPDPWATLLSSPFAPKALLHSLAQVSHSNCPSSHRSVNSTAVPCIIQHSSNNTPNGLSFLALDHTETVPQVSGTLAVTRGLEFQS